MSGTTEYTGFTITRITATRHQRERTQSGTRKTLIQEINRWLWWINGIPNTIEVGSSSWKFFPASCTLCSSGNRTLGPQHCVAVGIRLMTLLRDEDTKVSRGTRKCHAHFSDKQRHKKNRVGSMNGVVIEATIYTRHRQPSATGSPIQCIEEVCRMPWNCYFKRDEREEGFSTDIARPGRPQLHMNSASKTIIHIEADCRGDGLHNPEGLRNRSTVTAYPKI